MSHRRRRLRPALIGILLVLMLVGAARVTAPIQVSTDAIPAAAPAQPREGSAAPVTSSLLACPGPELQGLPDAAVTEQAQRVVVSAANAPLESLPAAAATQVGQRPAELTGELRIVPTGSTPPAVQTSRDRAIDLGLDGPEGAVVWARGALAPGVAATQAHLSEREQSRGLEVTPCLVPAEQSWLIAGGGQPGRLERLVLVNPGADPVTATVTVLDRDQAPDPPDGVDVVVPGGGRVVRLIDAAATASSAPAVRVSTEQGPLAAFLGDRWLQGSTDRGLELTTPTPPPAKTQLVPAVVRSSGAGSRTQLRVAVPGAEPAVVQVRALTPEGPVRVQQDVTLVPGARTQDIELSELPPGRYGLEVTSDVDVVVAGTAQTAPGAVGARGLAWSPATSPLRGLAGVVLDVPGRQQSGPVLQLAAGEAAAVEVVVVEEDGSVSRRRVELPGEATAEVALERTAREVWVRPQEGDVHAAVVWELTDSDGDLLSVAALSGLPLVRSITSVEPVLP